MAERRPVPLAASLSRRLLVLSAFTCVVGPASAVAGVRSMTRASTEELVREIDAHVRAGAARRCTRDPRSFVLATSSGIPVYAYDATTRRSGHPAAPVLERGALDIALAPGESEVRLGTPLRRMKEVTYRAAATGPCAWFVVRRRHSPLGVDAVLAPALIVLGATAFALGAMLAFVVRPLVQRIVDVRRLAADVGRSGVQMIGPRAHRDELDAIVEALCDAHASLLDERAALASSRAALVEHLARTAHDLRTPVASLQLSLEHVASLVDDAEQRRTLSGALRDAYYVGALTENLHLLSQLRGEHHLRTEHPVIDVVASVRATCLRLAVLARHGGIDLATGLPDVPINVRAEPLMFERALANLVENAIRHAAVGGYVAVVLEPHPPSFVLTVADSGPGFSAAALEQTRALGYCVTQAHTATRSSGRTEPDDPRRRGLGMAIAIEVAHRFGWTLALASSHEGAVVTMTGHRVDTGGFRVSSGAHGLVD